MTVKLSASELDASLSYVERAGASDFFPQPFEVAAIRFCWDRIRPVLEGLDLSGYVGKPAYRLMAPKHNYTLRPIQLLDPIDVILYTALVFRLAPSIQARRDGYQRGIVFSTQFVPPRDSPAPDLESDWDGWWEAVSRRTAASRSMGVADIADFFPRVYLHRLENALVALSEDREGSESLMSLLKMWSGGTSYGLPVGPTPSNFLAECLLIEVDEYLLSRDVNFVRNVDDYTFFGDSEAQCLRVLYELGSRLFLSQGLTFNMAKTKVLTPEDFTRWRLSPRTPEDEVRDQILDRVFGGDIYADITYEELTDEQRAAVDQVDAAQWLETAFRGEPADLRTIKFVLNFLSALRRPELVGPVIENLPRLIPVSEAVGRFFGVLDEVHAADRGRIGEALLRYITDGGFVPAFQSLWLLEPFTKAVEWNNLVDLRRLARDHNNPMVRRQAILAIGQSTDRSALLDTRLAYEDSSPWEARAILFACRNLPTDEGDAFYSSLRIDRTWTRDNALVKSVIAYGKSLR